MSAASIGADLERRTVKLLQSIGYKAERVSRQGRYGGGDVFGCLDILADTPDGPMYAQVTTLSGASHRRAKIRKSGLQWPVRLFVWRKVKNRWAVLSEDVFPMEETECVE